MPLPRGSKAGLEHVTKRAAEGADSSSVRTHLSLNGFSVIDAEATVGNGQQSQDPSAWSHSTTPGEHSSPEVPGTQVSLRIIFGLCSFPARWFLQISSDTLGTERCQWPGGMPSALDPFCHTTCPPSCNLSRSFRRGVAGEQLGHLWKKQPIDNFFAISHVAWQEG